MIINLVIASLRIRLQSEEGLNLTLGERFSAFVSKTGGEPDLTLNVSAGKAFIPMPAETVFEAPLVEETNGGLKHIGEHFWIVSRTNDVIYVRTKIKEPDHEPLLIMPRHKNIWHIFLDKKNTEIDPLPYPVDGLLLYYLTSLKGGIMIHGSGAISDRKGWLFTGRSGTGKTTIARIFDSCGDRVIHDDRLVLIKEDNGWAMHSTPVYRNDEPRSTKLDHLWLISHGRSNASSPLSGADAVGLVMANCVQQSWDREATERLAAAVEDLVSSVDVSRLLFVPDPKVRDYLIAREDKTMRSMARMAATLLDEKQVVGISAGGYSMWPALRPGDRMIITPMTEKISVLGGDVVALKRDGGFVAHRVTEVTIKDGESQYRTQGDSSIVPDPWIKEGDIAGIVRTIKRGDKEVVISPCRLPRTINRILAFAAITIHFIRRRLCRNSQKTMSFDIKRS